MIAVASPKMNKTCNKAIKATHSVGTDCSL